MLERLLERISLSKYRENFILKGGFLIAALVGLDTRATMDMDVTIQGHHVTEASIKSIFKDIISIPMNDDIDFKFKGITVIHEDHEYIGYRISLTGDFLPMSVPLKLDITTGDIITPKEIKYTYKTMMGNKNISILAYTIETILAEKIETIISRGNQTTRLRDYYDVYILQKLYYGNVDIKQLESALRATCTQRGTWSLIQSYKDVMAINKETETMHIQWKKYQNNFSYAENIDFIDTCDAILEIMNELRILA